MTTLAKIKEGEEAKIYYVECGHGLKNRLCELGLYDGTTVKVEKNDSNGPLILKVKDSKLVIGRCQAEKIKVK